MITLYFESLNKNSDEIQFYITAHSEKECWEKAVVKCGWERRNTSYIREGRFNTIVYYSEVYNRLHLKK